jgi:hypothetical protein
MPEYFPATGHRARSACPASLEIGTMELVAFTRLFALTPVGAAPRLLALLIG